MANTGPVWKNEEDRKVLAEVYRAFATRFDAQGNPTTYQEWFRGAGIVDYPDKRSLVINCNYKPLLMMKEVLALTTKYNLELFLREIDSNGNPKQ